MLAVMFVFSFVGGLISPYGQDEQFYTYTYMAKEYVAVTQNKDFRYAVADGQEFGTAAQAQFLLAQMTGKTEFDYKDVAYTLTEEGEDFYSISSGGTLLAIAYKDIVNPADNGTEPSFAVKYAALKAYSNAVSYTHLGVYKRQGLECGILTDKVPGLDAVSFGPDLVEIHSTRERMSIASVERTWRFLLGVLAADVYKRQQQILAVPLLHRSAVLCQVNVL